jgi:endonuclease/exonuclease/phosphatase family metal-dependent hydrolase
MARRLVAASYNIHGGVGQDGCLDLDRTIEVIRSLDADVVGLQEVGGHDGIDQLHRMADALGLAAIPGPTLVRRGGPYGNAVLSRLPVIRSRKLDLSVGRFERRGAIEVLLDVGERRVRLIATHLGLRPGERRRQRRMLADAIDAGDDGELLVLLGDLNQWWPPRGALDARWPGLEAARFVPTYPARFPLLALDRILARPGHAVRRLEAPRTPLTRRASDHLPLRAALEVGTALASMDPTGGMGCKRASSTWA